MAGETMQQFLDREPSVAELTAMRKQNGIPQWDSPHPHGMVVDGGFGPYLYGRVNVSGEDVKVRDVCDANGQILCNSAGYGNPEVEEARARASRTKVDAFSGNFTNATVEWAREMALKTLGDWRDDYVFTFVASGSEADSMLARAAFSEGNGEAELLNLRNGYSGATLDRNAACGQPAWKGHSTAKFPFMHEIEPTMASLQFMLESMTPEQRVRYFALQCEAGQFGVGGFGDIPEGFMRGATLLLRGHGTPEADIAEYLEWKRTQKREKAPTGGVYPDEIQTGFGRTARVFWASQKIFEGMAPPEGIAMAKGAGGGHPGAGFFLRKDVAANLDGLTYHTFGPALQTAATIGTVCNMAMRDNWTENARVQGERLWNGIDTKVRGVSRVPLELDGRGLMVAVVLDCKERVNAVLKRAPLDGWVPGKGGMKGERLRIAPPINSKGEFIDEMVEKMAVTLASTDVEAANPPA